MINIINISEMQNRTTLRYQFTCIMMAIRKRQIISIKEEVEMLESGTPMPCEQECKNGATALENV